MEVSKFYRSYLFSEHWQQFRQVALEYYGKKCADCGTTEGIFNVHHLTYENIGEELLEDVVVLCRDCHHKRHFTPCEHKKLSRMTSQTGGEMRFWWYCDECNNYMIPRKPNQKEKERAEKVRLKMEKYIKEQEEKQALKALKKKNKPKSQSKKKKRRGHTPEYWEKRRAGK